MGICVARVDHRKGYIAAYCELNSIARGWCDGDTDVQRQFSYNMHTTKFK